MIMSKSTTLHSDRGDHRPDPSRNGQVDGTLTEFMSGMSLWRCWLFRLLARVDASASAQFGIALDQVVEVEERVEI